MVVARADPERPPADVALVVVALDSLLAGHVALALHRHRAALERTGRPVLQALVELERVALDAARSGPERTGGDARLAAAAAQLYGDPRATLLERDLTVGEAAAELGVSERTIRRRIAAGELASFTVGRARRIRRRELEAFRERGGS